jgi:hypothetical protein
MAITGTIGGSFSIHDRRTIGINTGVDIPVNWAPSTVYADGVGALQANQLYQGSLNLTAGVYNFDLSGALTDAYGTSVAMARVKALGFQNNSASNIMTLGNHATAAWATWLGATSTKIIRPGGWFISAAPDATGWAVTATTGDILKIAGTGTDNFYIFVLGGLT